MIRVPLAGLLAVGLCAAAVRPVAARSAEEVQTLVERAAQHIRDVGRQQAFADFNRPDGGFVDGELYVFCTDAAGQVLAQGDNPKMVGKSFANVRDAAGNSPSAELFRVVQPTGKGWLEYLWPNAAAGRVQHKVAYVVRIDEKTVCGSGYYKADRP